MAGGLIVSEDERGEECIYVGGVMLVWCVGFPVG